MTIEDSALPDSPRSKPDDDRIGFSADNPIIINGVADHGAGVAAEYLIIASLFGVRGRDWKPLMQSVMSHGERLIDRISIQLANGTDHALYFDVTALFALRNDRKPRQQQDTPEDSGASSLKNWQNSIREAMVDDLRRRKSRADDADES